MRSARDLTAAAAIREAATRLFAERGVAAVSIRDIAAAAGVSAPLVIHHFKSKDGLRAAVDARAAEWVGEVLQEFAHAPGGPTATSVAAVLGDALGAQPALVGYLRRLLVEDGPAGESLFRALFEATLAGMAALEADGLARPAPDPAARAAFLLVNDLAVLLLRDRVAAVLGVDPVGPDGLARWSATVLDVYGRGVFATGEEGSAS